MPQTAFAFIDIESERLQYKTSPYVNVMGFSLASLSGNTNKKSISAQNKLILKQNDNEYILLFQYIYATVNDIKNENAGYIHLRHILHNDSLYNYEYFGQLATNEFEDNMRRALIGNGLRIQLSDAIHKNLYLGIGVFYEAESFTQQQQDAIRANTYITYVQSIMADTTIAITGYIQPIIDDISKVRYMLNASLTHYVSATFNISLQYNIINDNDLSTLAEVTDSSTQINLAYIFK